MISFKKFLIQEEFMDAWTDNRGEFRELFVNPTIKEIKSIDNYVRYIIDLENKKLYVWDGDYLIHTQMVRRIQKQYNILKDVPITSNETAYIETLDKYIQGHTRLNQDHHSDLYDYMLLGHAMKKDDFIVCSEKFQTLYDSDMSWLNKYFGFYESGIKDMIMKYLIICEKRIEAYRKFEED